MHDPRESHLYAVYRVLHYLKGIREKGILFKRNDYLSLEAYVDADYAKLIVGRISISVIVLSREAIW